MPYDTFLYRFILIFMALTITLSLVHEQVSGQEKRAASHPAGTLSGPLSPRAVAQRGIDAINGIRNVMVITQEKAGIPNMRNVFRKPWIAQTITAVNRADTVHGSSFQIYVLEDTFRLRMAYDGKYLVAVDDEESPVVHTTDLRQYPYDAHSVMGPLHLNIRNILEQALKRNATLNTTEENDSLKLEVLFPNLYIELEATRITISKDTLGFVSRYVIYLDKHTFLPIKLVRDMPHQTSVQTILFQRINFKDTLTIDALKTPMGGVPSNLTFADNLSNKRKRSDINSLIGQSLDGWRLARADGDTLAFTTLKGKKGVIVFNSIGWKPCLQVLPFLTRLATTPATTVVSIEPFVTNTDALKKHRETHAIRYPIVMTSRTLKQIYPGVQVPTFLVTDTRGIVREVIIGYAGAATETQLEQALKRMQ